MQRSCGKRNGKDIQRISCIRFNPNWMIPFRLMVVVAVRKVLCRLHIGHTFSTHFYLLKGEEPLVCIPCHQLCSAEHLLTECVDLIDWRRNSFNTESLKVLFF